MATIAVVAEEESGTSFQKGLSDWWIEEAEYVFHRIERWAAFARGYNRLRSEGLPRGNMTMQEDQGQRWTISANNLADDDNSGNSRFHALKRSRAARNTPEETKINCCGTFNYKSNGNLDSNCLETYSYDHSIYFKTIGDIRNSRKDLNKDEDERTSETDENVEWKRVDHSTWNLEGPEVDEEEEEIDFNRNRVGELGNVKEVEEPEAAEEEENNNYSKPESRDEREDKCVELFKGTLVTSEYQVTKENDVDWPNIFFNYEKSEGSLNGRCDQVLFKC